MTLDRNVIAELFLQRVLDDAKRGALVMAHKVLHVLQQESLRPVALEDPRNVEKKRALRSQRKP